MDRKDWPFEILPIDEGKSCSQKYLDSLTEDEKWGLIEEFDQNLFLMKGGNMDEYVFNRTAYLTDPIWSTSKEAC